MAVDEVAAPTSHLAQSQEDFYYSLDYSRLDLVLWAKNHGVAHDVIAAYLGTAA